MHLRIRPHDVVPQTGVQRERGRDFEIVLRPECIAMKTPARRDFGVFDDVRRIQFAQQKACVRAARRRQQRPGRTEAGSLRVAEPESREAAVRALALVGVHALALESERQRVLAARPLQVVLQRVVVQVLGERAGVGAAPLRRRVRTGKAHFGKC